jgi:hypothetical protein
VLGHGGGSGLGILECGYIADEPRRGVWDREVTALTAPLLPELPAVDSPLSSLLPLAALHSAEGKRVFPCHSVDTFGGGII